MKTKRVNRYYCDHCKKSGCSKHHMNKHELSCVRNPARVCMFCRHIDKEQSEQAKALTELVAMIRAGKTLDEVHDAARSCPACILAAIVQSGVNVKESDADESGYPPVNPFHEWRFKEAKDQFWADRRPEH